MTAVKDKDEIHDIMTRFIWALWEDNNRNPIIATNRACTEAAQNVDELSRLMPLVRVSSNGDLTFHFVSSIEEANKLREEGV